jgi:hypothetical protein
MNLNHSKTLQIMKYIAFFIISLLFSAPIQAQITVTGASTAGANTTYNLGTAQTVQVFNSDAGTNLYSNIPFTSYSQMPPYYEMYRIYRVGGVWTLDQAIVSASVGVRITTLYTISNNSNNPPCDWGNGVLLAGTCGELPVQSATIAPGFITIPQFSAAAISAIAAPQKGMLVFDTTNNCLKLYNGTAWKCLVTQ